MKISIFFLFSCMILAQTRYPGVPTVPLQSKIEARYQGVWPDSKVKDGDPEETHFKRIEFRPPTLILLARSTCSENVGQKELIDRAKQMRSDNGQLVEIDWGRIKSGEDVVFQVVILLEKRITRYTLKASDGVYRVANSNVDLQSHYQTAKLVFPSGRSCVDEDEISIRDMRVTVANLLNRMAVPHLNSASE